MLFVLSNNFDEVWSVNNQFKSLDSYPTWILIDLEKVVCTFFLITTLRVMNVQNYSLAITRHTSDFHLLDIGIASTSMLNAMLSSLCFNQHNFDGECLLFPYLARCLMTKQESIACIFRDFSRIHFHDSLLN